MPKKIEHDPRTCENSKPCFDCEYPNIEHDYKCQEPNCGKPATRNLQTVWHDYEIQEDGTFKELDNWGADINEFWCDEHNPAN